MAFLERSLIFGVTALGPREQKEPQDVGGERCGWRNPNSMGKHSLGVVSAIAPYPEQAVEILLLCDAPRTAEILPSDVMAFQVCWPNPRKMFRPHRWILLHL
jgi:hypothetical protein